ncbi:hypothetical protein Ahia01_001292300 [Argonauta hians]
MSRNDDPMEIQSGDIDFQALNTSKKEILVICDDFHMEHTLIDKIQETRDKNCRITFLLTFRHLSPLIADNGLGSMEFAVLPLNELKSKELFSKIFPGPIEDNVLDQCINKCSGFPSLIIKLAKDLSLFDCPEGISDILRHFVIPDEYYASCWDVINASPRCVRDLLSSLLRIPHQFCYSELLRLKLEESKLHKALRLIKKSGLIFENENHTYSMLPIVRELYSCCYIYRMNTLGTRCDDCLESANMTYRIIREAQGLYRQEHYVPARKIMSDHQSHIYMTFEKLMVSKCSDTYIYGILKEIVSTAHRLVCQTIGNAPQFFQFCYNLSLSLGSREQQGLLLLRWVYSLTTSNNQKSLPDALTGCSRAQSIFEELKQHYLCLQVLNLKCLIYYYLGQYQNAKRLCKKAIDMPVPHQSPEEVNFFKIYIRCIEVYNYINLGLVERGVAAFDDLVNEPAARTHPTFGIMVSTYAWSQYEQGHLGQSIEMYIRALNILQKNNLEKNRWMVPMCYIADLCSLLGRRHGLALSFLRVAEKIQEKYTRRHANFARIHLVKARIYSRLQNYTESIKILKTAVTTMTEIKSSHHILLDILFLLAHCYLVRDREKAERAFLSCQQRLIESPPRSQSNYPAWIKEHLQGLRVRRPQEVEVSQCDLCQSLRDHNDLLQAQLNNQLPSDSEAFIEGFIATNGEVEAEI